MSDHMFFWLLPGINTEVKPDKWAVHKLTPLEEVNPVTMNMGRVNIAGANIYYIYSNCSLLTIFMLVR